jgi:hypothetical protein
MDLTGILPYIVPACALVGSSFAAAAWWNARKARAIAEESSGALIEVGGKVYRLTEAVDGRLTELLATNARLAATAAALARAEGVAAGEQSQRDRTAASDAVEP